MSIQRLSVVLSVGLCAVACAPPAQHAAPPPPPAPASAPALAASAPPAATSAAPASSAAPTSSAEHAEHAHSAMHHRFKNAKKWSKIFDDPARDKWQKPDQVIKALSLAPDAKVADIGAGTGYFSVRLARAVPRGKVFAVDIEPTLLEYIRHRAEHEGLKNVSTVLGNTTSPNLKGPIDLALVVDTYHHIDDRPGYFRGVAHELSPHGRVVIVDFRMGKLPVGPPEKHRIPPAQTTREMQQAGYKKCGSFDKLPYQYVLEFGLDCKKAH